MSASKAGPIRWTSSKDGEDWVWKPVVNGSPPEDVWANPDDEPDRWTAMGVEIPDEEIDWDAASEEDWKKMRQAQDDAERDMAQEPDPESDDDLHERETEAEQALRANNAAVAEIRRLNAEKIKVRDSDIRKPATEDERMLTVRRMDKDLHSLTALLGIQTNRVYPARDDSYLRFLPTSSFQPKLMVELVELMRGLQSQIASVAQSIGLELDVNKQEWLYPAVTEPSEKKKED